MVEIVEHGPGPVDPHGRSRVIERKVSERGVDSERPALCKRRDDLREAVEPVETPRSARLGIVFPECLGQ